MGLGKNSSAAEGAFKTVVRFLDAVPAPIHEGNRTFVLIVGAILLVLGYTIPNHYHLFEPQYLELLAIDHATPLMPWTIFVYTSEYIYFFVAYWLIRNDITRNRYLWSMFSVEFISVIFFVFFPTTYPRQLYPVPEDTVWYIKNAFELLHAVDNPSNCFPSLHVSACFVTAFVFLKEARWKFILFFVWASAVAVSTMTTKQHYFVDVVSGLTLASAAAYVFVIRAKYRPTSAALIYAQAAAAPAAHRAQKQVISQKA